MVSEGRPAQRALEPGLETQAAVWTDRCTNRLKPLLGGAIAVWKRTPVHAQRESRYWSSHLHVAADLPVRDLLTVSLNLEALHDQVVLDEVFSQELSGYLAPLQQVEGVLESCRNLL